MYTIKQVIGRGLLAGEVVIFAGLYFFGTHGEITSLNKKNNDLVKQIEVLRREITGLKQEMDEWNTHPWYKEKIARETLQMAYPGDEIYLID